MSTWLKALSGPPSVFSAGASQRVGDVARDVPRLVMAARETTSDNAGKLPHVPEVSSVREVHDLGGWLVQRGAAPAGVRWSKVRAASRRTSRRPNASRAVRAASRANEISTIALGSQCIPKAGAPPCGGALAYMPSAASLGNPSRLARKTAMVGRRLNNPYHPFPGRHPGRPMAPSSSVARRPSLLS